MDVSTTVCICTLGLQYGTTDTAEEKDKFLEDAMRLAQDVSNNQTFYTVKPLLNFWAAFTPSKEVLSNAHRAI